MGCLPSRRIPTFLHFSPFIFIFTLVTILAPLSSFDHLHLPFAPALFIRSAFFHQTHSFQTRSIIDQTRIASSSSNPTMDDKEDPPSFKYRGWRAAAAGLDPHQLGSRLAGEVRSGDNLPVPSPSPVGRDPNSPSILQGNAFSMMRARGDTSRLPRKRSGEYFNPNKPNTFLSRVNKGL